MKSILFILLTLFSTTSLSCDEFQNSSLLKEVISATQDSKIERWEGFSLRKNPTILVDVEKNPKCIVLYDGKNWEFFNFKNEVSIGNNVFEFVLSAEGNSEVNNLLKSRGIERAIIMSIHNFLGEDFTLGILYTVLIHESFHWFGEFGSGHWPTWIYDIDLLDRTAVVTDCYKPNKTTLQAEYRLLLDTLKTGSLSPEFRSKIQNFIKHRDQRYSSAPSCEEKEAAWELTEGVAEYVGWKASLGLFVSSEELIQILEEDFENQKTDDEYEYFYKLGFLQLYAISETQKDIFLVNNPVMGKGRTSKDSIYNLLKKTFK